MTDRRRRIARRLRPLPALLLVAVAANQIRLARAADLNAWSGGGFGMFATTDGWGARHLHAYAIRPGVRRELPIPRELAEAVRRALALPSEDRLRGLASELARQPTPDEGPLAAVAVNVFVVRHDPETLAPRGELLRAIEVPASELPVEAVSR